ncbi:nucleoporin NUP53 isoform X2 [Seriola lalandi dorsalis]|uniref:nucleoporin NUP53 isoform X2 n=1 Tax=Seriola lalandi dorsalis TaxID=1841481 RepID=UPI000C6FBA09|nr:nucleoporin NUP53 isoform X2 [Seriola lalandi dorsalis]XP_056244535.1 nucleoporin NUP35 isoform X1 [Seriola aureovittata]
MELQVGNEPMTLGSPTSPKATSGAQFLPGFLMGDLPAPATPQPRPFSLAMPIVESTGGGGGSAPQPVVPTPKDKSGAPPIRSIHEDLMTVGTPLNAHRQSFPVMQSPLSARQAATPGTGVQQVCLSPAQVDPFYSQGESLSSDDQLDQTWVTVFGFPPASASYILLQFAQYGNILKHMMASPGNWMHLQYQSRLQARKALSKDGKVFGDAIMVGVKPCIDKSVMDSSEAVSSPLASSFSSSALPSTPRSAIRPLSAAYRSSSNDYQVVADRQTPRKDDSFVSKAMEYMFGW